MQPRHAYMGRAPRTCLELRTCLFSTSPSIWLSISTIVLKPNRTMPPGYWSILRYEEALNSSIFFTLVFALMTIFLGNSLFNGWLVLWNKSWSVFNPKIACDGLIQRNTTTSIKVSGRQNNNFLNVYTLNRLTVFHYGSLKFYISINYGRRRVTLSLPTHQHHLRVSPLNCPPVAHPKPHLRKIFDLAIETHRTPSTSFSIY